MIRFDAHGREMGPALPAAVVQVDKWQEHLLEGKDIALLKVPGHHLPTVKLGNAWDLEIGEPLVHIGQPEDALERLNLI